MQSSLKVSNWLWVGAGTCGRAFPNSSQWQGEFYCPFCYQGEPVCCFGFGNDEKPFGAHISAIMVGKTDYICPAAWKKGHRALSFIPSTTDKSKTVCAAPFLPELFL